MKLIIMSLYFIEYNLSFYHGSVLSRPQGSCARDTLVYYFGNDLYYIIIYSVLTVSDLRHTIKFQILI